MVFMTTVVTRLSVSQETGPLRHYDRVPDELVTIHLAILNYVSFHSLCCLMHRKVKSFKQTVFLSEQQNV